VTATGSRGKKRESRKKAPEKDAKLVAKEGRRNRFIRFELRKRGLSLWVHIGKEGLTSEKGKGKRPRVYNESTRWPKARKE